ncbi:putative ovule protein [Forsythia ovata]|uniref:Ovule protein n=1 Tax=Forsythia ovata TaxID=205694 RepID=A0ABD1X0C8_9LAMI
MLKKTDDNSDWWVVDGEMHEIGENVPPREWFVIPRENIPNKRRKQLREQFMRRTRLVLKESEHEPWCKRYMELSNELRENWERLYWDEGYSKKLAQDHANYDSAEDDDEDFNPYSAPIHITLFLDTRNKLTSSIQLALSFGELNSAKKISSPYSFHLFSFSIVAGEGNPNLSK